MSVKRTGGGPLGDAPFRLGAAALPLSRSKELAPLPGAPTQGPPPSLGEQPWPACPRIRADDSLFDLRGNEEAVALAQSLARALPHRSPQRLVDRALQQPVLLRSLAYFARDARATPESALLHFLVNSDETLRGTEPWAASSRREAVERASAYAQSVGYGALRERKGRFYLVTPDGARQALELSPKKTASLGPDALTRALGRAVNELRFGTTHIVPPVPSLERREQSFSPRSGHWATHLSVLAYAPVDVIRKQLELWGFDLESFTPLGVEDGVAAGFVVKDRTHCIHTVFRGTASASDVATDLNAVPSSTDWLPAKAKASVHAGFDRSLERLWPAWTAAFAKARRRAGPQPRLMFSGHSLGGAKAQLAALRSSLFGQSSSPTGPLDVAVYTLGSPRVGNEGFRQLYDERVKYSYRMVSGSGSSEDPISKVPPDWIGYRHAGTQVTLHQGSFDVRRPKNAPPPAPTPAELEAFQVLLRQLGPSPALYLGGLYGPLDRAPYKEPGVGLHFGGTYVERLGPHVFPAPLT